MINTPTALQVLKKETDGLLDKVNNFTIWDCDTNDEVRTNIYRHMGNLAYLLGRVIDEVEKIGTKLKNEI